MGCVPSILLCGIGGNRTAQFDELAILRYLGDARATLDARINQLETLANSQRNSARQAIRDQKRLLALTCLARSRLAIKQANRDAQYSMRVSELADSIEQGVTAAAVAQALQSGNDALQRVTAAIDPDRIDDILEDLRDHISNLSETAGRLAQSGPIQEAANGGVPIDDDELEHELAELQAEVDRESHAHRNHHESFIPAMPRAPQREPERRRAAVREEQHQQPQQQHEEAVVE